MDRRLLSRNPPRFGGLPSYCLGLLPCAAGEVASEASRRGQSQFAVAAAHETFQFSGLASAGTPPLHHASHGPPPPLPRGGSMLSEYAHEEREIAAASPLPVPTG